MIEKREGSLKVKVVHILEDGIERQWKADAKMFSKDLRQISFLGSIDVGGTLTRVGMSVNFEGHVSGTCELACSRCLKKYEHRIDGDVKVTFVPDERDQPGEGEIELSLQDIDTQVYEGDEIDIYEPVRDHIALVVPIRPLCDPACKGLCHVCGISLNENECGCDRSSNDPRLAALKNIKFD